MKGKKRLRDAEAVATYTEGLLDAYAGRLDAIIQSGGPTVLSRLSKMRKKKGKSYTGNLGRVDEDITMGDAFNASGSGSGSGSGIGISSSVSSGSDGGSDSGTCEIPALTQQERADFVANINKSSTHQNGKPRTSADKRREDDEQRTLLGTTASSYDPVRTDNQNMYACIDQNGLKN